MDDPRASQEQRYRRYSSEHLLPPEIEVWRRGKTRKNTATQKQPEEELLENWYCRQLEQSGQLKQLVALYIEDMVQKSEPKGYSKLKSVVIDILNKRFD